MGLDTVSVLSSEAHFNVFFCVLNHQRQKPHGLEISSSCTVGIVFLASVYVNPEDLVKMQPNLMRSSEYNTGEIIKAFST